MTDTKALIAEAREEACYQGRHGGDMIMADLLHRLIGALENEIKKGKTINAKISKSRRKNVV